MKVRATRSGTVYFVGVHGGWGSSYGTHVIVQSSIGGKKVRHSYNHLSREYVTRGQKISEGQLIGLAGNSGNVTGPHLHYEERTSPFGYWDHRRPVLDQTSGLPAIDVSALAVSIKARSNYGNGRLYKRELAAALKAAGMKRTPMNVLSSKMGSGARENTKRLQKRWYGINGSGMPGHRLVNRLGNRRRAWRTVK